VGGSTHPDVDVRASSSTVATFASRADPVACRARCDDRTFTEDYPNKPPVCKFKMVGNTNKPLFHPNVYPSGKICLSLLDADKAWKPSLTIKHLLIGIQTLLDDPNNADPAQEEPYRAFKNDKKEYEARVKQQVALLRS